MAINPIALPSQPLGQVSGAGFQVSRGTGGQVSGVGFQVSEGASLQPLTPNPQPLSTDFPGMLQHLLGQLNDLAKNADTQAIRAAAGEDVDLHQVVIAMEAAGLGFQLGLQVRNKLVEAYQEIIRMQV